MDAVMVLMAQIEQVLKLRFTAIRPVFDVMALSERHSAARPAARRVASVESASYCGRNRSSLSAHVEGTSALVVLHFDDARIAGDAAGRFRGNAGARLENRLAVRRGILENALVDVDHDLVPIAGLAWVQASR
jgi:hypothetical protein